ncbi:MAG TPA: phytanoyl-CoA dioxygenase family protein [Gemmataceae bacterium]|nr:phytanoyl-CoA dioxygenase family protein [Gemmataceae bacterium]
MTQSESHKEQLERDGVTVLPEVFSPQEVETIRHDLTATLAAGAQGEAAIHGETGGLYAARNVLALWPGAAHVWRQSRLLAILAELLGRAFGLVRVLFFDKPPDQSWALPWHKDTTIAVSDNRRPSTRFAKPTRKAGVPHVDAPVEVLQTMLTARIHLDDVTEENGPLKVIPGSHHSGKVLALGNTAPVSVLAQCGDVLLMRPLVIHCSNRSRPGNSRHRRILHLEFAATPELPDGYTWHTFLAAFPFVQATAVSLQPAVE